jgi:hypothetical protein
MPYAFIDEGLDYMEDEPIVVGPYDTEEDAARDADGRAVVLLLSYADYAKGVDVTLEDETDE